MTKHLNIAASLRDQVLDVRLGLLSKDEWDRRFDAAVALGVHPSAMLLGFREGK